jgi:hypothetical protein
MACKHSTFSRWASAALALAGAAACAPEHEPATDLAAVALAAPQWTRTYPYGLGVHLAVDPAGNVVAAGSMFGDLLVAKYDPAGTLLWERAFDYPAATEKASWVAVDGAGNVFVSGYLVYGASQDPGGFVLAKYDPAGGLLWSDVEPITFGQTVRVEADAAGNAYLTGKGWTASSLYVDFVTVKYAPDGTRLWTRTHGLDASNEAPASLAVSADGHVAVTGSPSAGSPMLTVLYDTDGNVVWSQASPPGQARDVAFGPGGDVFVAGGTSQLVVARFGADGRAGWTRSVKGSTANRLAVDAAGDVFVTGIDVQTSGMPYTDWITAKLAASGAVQWTQRYDAHAGNDEVPRALAPTGDGGVVVTGSGGPGPTSGVLSYVQLVTAEYAADGTLAWIFTTFDAIDGVAVRVAGSSVYGLARSPMTAFRVERPGGAALPPPPTDPVPPPTEPTPAPAPAPPPAVTPTLYVADVTLSVRSSGSKSKVTARVAVRDAASAAVAGATVSATWTTPAGAASATATTDTSGTANFVATGRAGTYTLSVTNVAKAGYTFDATRSVLTRSVTVP